jgi:hypothetical protein
MTFLNFFTTSRKCFSLIGKYFSLTNFSNGKQIQKNLKSDFSETTFQKTNTVLVVILGFHLAFVHGKIRFYSFLFKKRLQETSCI